MSVSTSSSAQTRALQSRIGGCGTLPGDHPDAVVCAQVWH